MIRVQTARQTLKVGHSGIYRDLLSSILEYLIILYLIQYFVWVKLIKIFWSIMRAQARGGDASELRNVSGCPRKSYLFFLTAVNSSNEMTLESN
jgi:hypothetical protein